MNFLAGPKKTVIDFGCGEGVEAVQMAQSGVRRVIGIDNRDDVFADSQAQGVRCRCGKGVLIRMLDKRTCRPVVSIDAFEHFANPANLRRMGPHDSAKSPVD
jgi:cyclopropane fatty-acyl-phospholipid synthase-like methyltransferase